MKTLIELYDERAIENILAADMFRPEEIVYLCPSEIVQDERRQQKLQAFFNRHGWNPKVSFQEASLFKADRILKQMMAIAERSPDCALDVTGGTDAALFAGGMFAAEKQIPTFTYSRKKNRFYNINNAPFAEDVVCDLMYSVEDFFLMAGGTLQQGRVDNGILGNYMDQYDDFFRIFLKYRRVWTEIIGYMQRVAASDGGETVQLRVDAAYTVKGERGSRNSANESALRAFEQLGFIQDLQITPQERVTFTFRDANTRMWLRDIGSVLELYTYKACLDSGIFNDVISSAVVCWDDVQGHASVSNEIDVMAVRGVVPLFISCKTCDIRTEAINELAILRDRFGGKGAKAAIVTAEPCNAAARHRAAQLGIAVIDLEELETERLIPRLKTIMKVE